MQRWYSRIYSNSDGDQPEARFTDTIIQVCKRIAVMEHIDDKSCQEHISAEGMHKNISE